MESNSLTYFTRAWIIDQSKHMQVQLALQFVVVGLHGRDKSEGPRAADAPATWTCVGFAQDLQALHRPRIGLA